MKNFLSSDVKTWIGRILWAGLVVSTLSNCSQRNATVESDKSSLAFAMINRQSPDMKPVEPESSVMVGVIKKIREYQFIVQNISFRTGSVLFNQNISNEALLKGVLALGVNCNSSLVLDLENYSSKSPTSNEMSYEIIARLKYYLADTKKYGEFKFKPISGKGSSEQIVHSDILASLQNGLSKNMSEFIKELNNKN